jgi:hypothetical protein
MGLQKCIYGELWCKSKRYGRYINWTVYIRLWRYVPLSGAILHFRFSLMWNQIPASLNHVPYSFRHIVVVRSKTGLQFPGSDGDGERHLDEHIHSVFVCVHALTRIDLKTNQLQAIV